jgi:hypothetical protein
MPYLPFDQRCILIPSSGTNDPAGSQQAQQAIVELQQMVVRAQAGADSFIDRDPGDFRSLGLNLMKDVQRSVGGGTHGVSPGYGNRPWASRFVTGPGGHAYFWPSNPRWAPPGGGRTDAGGASGPCLVPSGCGPNPNPCDGEDYEPADVAPSDEMPGAASLAAPALPSMTTTQSVSMPAVYAPSTTPVFSGGPAAFSRGVSGVRGVGAWTPSIAQPGAVPANCAAGGIRSIPWWLWLLGGLAVAAVVGDEKQTRRANGQKRAA